MNSQIRTFVITFLGIVSNSSIRLTGEEVSFLIRDYLFLGIKRKIDPNAGEDIFPDVSLKVLVILLARLYQKIVIKDSSVPRSITITTSTLSNIILPLINSRATPENCREYLLSLPIRIFPLNDTIRNDIYDIPSSILNSFYRNIVIANIANDINSLVIPTRFTAYIPDVHYSQTVEEYIEANGSTRRSNNNDSIDIIIQTIRSRPSTDEVELPMDSPRESSRSNNNNNSDLEVKLRDLKVRYTNCFGVIVDSTNPNVITVNNVLFVIDFERSGENIHIHYNYLSPLNGKLITQTDIYTEERFTFPLPGLGFRETSNGLIYIERRHKKSGNSRYRRGFRFDNVKYHYVSNNEFLSLPNYKLPKVITQRDSSIVSENSNTSSLKDSLELFFEIVNPLPQKSTSESITSVLSYEKLSSLITTKYCIKLDARLNVFTLIRGKFILGVYHLKDKVFYIPTDIFNNELDYLNIPYIVRSE